MKQREAHPTPIDINGVLERLERKVQGGGMPGMRVFPSGFHALDRRISGGLRQGDLFLLGASQGAGKTTFAFQMARNIAASGECLVLYLCYEHSEEDLLLRLISMESAAQAPTGEVQGLRLLDLPPRLWQASASQHGLTADLARDPLGRRALERIAEYAGDLRVMKASASVTDMESISNLVEECRQQSGKDVLLVVDYLQKVPLQVEGATEDERIGRITESLKELALTHTVPVLAIVASDKEGLQARRLRAHHLRGSTALLYEADVIIIMNEKSRIVSRQAVDMTPFKAAAMSNWVVFSIEKNRAGRDLVDFQLRKLFAYGMFDPSGDAIGEPLVDEAAYTE